MKQTAHAAPREQPRTAHREVDRGPHGRAFHAQGGAALSRMASDAPISLLPALRALHRRLFIEARAEYDGALELEAQREASPVRTTLSDGGASLRNHLPRMLGGRKTGRTEDAAMDHRAWSNVFTQLSELKSAIDADVEHQAIEHLRLVADGLAVQKRRTRAQLVRMESGADASVFELELIVAACVTIASAGVGAEAAAAGASLLKVAGLSAAAAAATRTTFSLARVGSERAQGLHDDAWLSAVLDGAEDGVSTLLFALVGGKLAARFVPKLARYLGAHVPDTFLVRVGQILHLRGPIPRDFFVTTGSRVLWDWLSGSASAVLSAPVHAAFEKLRGHKTSPDAFLDAVLHEVVTGGAFQVVLNGLTHAIVRMPVGAQAAGQSESTQFHDLLANPGIGSPEARLAKQVELDRYDDEIAPMLKDVSDDEAKAVIGYTGSDHDLINLALRTRDKQLLPVMRPYIELARRGAAAMPTHEGPVWRGVRHMSRGALARYRVGAIVTDPGFVSTTARADNVFVGEVEMEIQSKTGRDISRISLHQGEREVLFQPGTRFRVLSRQDQGGHTRLVLEEELRP